MNYRNTALYKSLDSYAACAIAEGFSGADNSLEEQLTAWQWLVDTGFCWQLQGWFGRTASALIANGNIQAQAIKHV